MLVSCVLPTEARYGYPQVKVISPADAGAGNFVQLGANTLNRISEREKRRG